MANAGDLKSPVVIPLAGSSPALGTASERMRGGEGVPTTLSSERVQSSGCVRRPSCAVPVRQRWAWWRLVGSNQPHRRPPSPPRRHANTHALTRLAWTSSFQRRSSRDGFPGACRPELLLASAHQVLEGARRCQRGSSGIHPRAATDAVRRSRGVARRPLR